MAAKPITQNKGNIIINYYLYFYFSRPLQDNPNKQFVYKP